MVLHCIHIGSTFNSPMIYIQFTLDLHWIHIGSTLNSHWIYIEFKFNSQLMHLSVRYCIFLWSVEFLNVFFLQLWMYWIHIRSIFETNWIRSVVCMCFKNFDLAFEYDNWIYIKYTLNLKFWTCLWNVSEVLNVFVKF